MNPMSVDEVRAELLKCCEGNASALIEGTPINLDKAPSILLDSAQFFAAITAEKPAAVFSWQSVFNVDEWLESELEAAGWDEDKVGDEDGYWPSLQQAKVHLKPQLAVVEKYSGAPYFLTALYTADGMARRMTYQASWHTDLTDLVEDMLEGRLAAVRLAHSRIDASNMELIAQLIDEIAARDDFQAAKGLPKRALLVQALYGDKIPKHPKGLMTRLKQHLDEMDVNFAHVLKAADEKAWVIKAVKR